MLERNGIGIGINPPATNVVRTRITGRWARADPSNNAATNGTEATVNAEPEGCGDDVPDSAMSMCGARARTKSWKLKQDHRSHCHCSHTAGSHDRLTRVELDRKTDRSGVQHHRNQMKPKIEFRQVVVIIGLIILIWPQPSQAKITHYRASDSIKLPKFNFPTTATPIPKEKPHQLFEPPNEETEGLQRYLWDDWRRTEGPLSPTQRGQGGINQPLRQPSSAFHCYDIESKDNLITRYSLTNISTCESRPNQYTEATMAEMMVLHLNKESNVVADSCRLTVSKRLSFCDNVFFRNYGSKLLVIEEPVYLDPDQCQDIIAHQRLSIVFEGQDVKFDVNPSGESHFAFYSIGNLDDDGWCFTK